MLILPLGMNIPDIRLYELMCTRAQRDLVASKNKVTRLLSTREKSIKIEHLTWYLQCFVCIIIPGPELQKYAKLVFHPEQLCKARATDLSVTTTGRYIAHWHALGCGAQPRARFSAGATYAALLGWDQQATYVKVLPLGTAAAVPQCQHRWRHPRVTWNQSFWLCR